MKEVIPAGRLDMIVWSLWITETASCQKYVAERTGAEARAVEAKPGAIRVELTTKTDLVLYDQPLTLATAVSSGGGIVSIQRDGTR